MDNPDHGALSALDSAPVWLDTEPLTAAGLRGASSSSTSGRTRASTGCARCRTSGRGTSATATAGSSSSACTRPSSASSTTSTTCAARSPRSTSATGGHRQRLRDLAVARQPLLAAVYLVDGEGRVRFQHFGEGRTRRPNGDPAAPRRGRGARRRRRRRPRRAGRLGCAAVPGDLPGLRPRRADDSGRREWALAGEWSVEQEAAVLEAARRLDRLPFEARDVNLVLAPPDSGGPVRFSVRLDGEAPGAAHGLDVDEHGEGTLVRAAACTSSSAGEGPSAAGPSRSPSPAGRARVRLHLRLIGAARLSLPCRAPRHGGGLRRLHPQRLRVRQLGVAHPVDPRRARSRPAHARARAPGDRRRVGHLDAAGRCGRLGGSGTARTVAVMALVAAAGSPPRARLSGRRRRGARRPLRAGHRQRHLGRGHERRGVGRRTGARARDHAALPCRVQRRDRRGRARRRGHGGARRLRDRRISSRSRGSSRSPGRWRCATSSRTAAPAEGTASAATRSAWTERRTLLIGLFVSPRRSPRAPATTGSAGDDRRLRRGGRARGADVRVFLRR